MFGAAPKIADLWSVIRGKVRLSPSRIPWQRLFRTVEDRIDAGLFYVGIYLGELLLALLLAFVSRAKVQESVHCTM